MDWRSQLELFGLVALAGGLGAIVGLEREMWGKPAGLRTHVFVAAGSALLILLGNGIVENFDESGSPGVITADPIRVLQAIVIGISFLGAGTIVQGGNRVEGLTTAASVYLTAGIGVAVAISYFTLAIATTLFAVSVLWGLGWVASRARTADAGREDDEPNPPPPPKDLPPPTS